MMGLTIIHQIKVLHNKLIQSDKVFATLAI